MSDIQLIVGLGNPGQQYEATRHNVGFWLLQEIAKAHHAIFKLEKKFSGVITTYSIVDTNKSVHLFLPMTYMNLSGRAVRAVAQFYKLKPEQIVVAHDDLDLANGDVRLKQGGGAGGHNGLKDVTMQLASDAYWRLRMGIGHPGHREAVLHYVLSAPNKQQETELHCAIDKISSVLPLIISGQTDKAMQRLHTKNVNK